MRKFISYKKFQDFKQKSNKYYKNLTFQSKIYKIWEFVFL